jgi:hypothetical protein
MIVRLVTLSGVEAFFFIVHISTPLNMTELEIFIFKLLL